MPLARGLGLLFDTTVTKSVIKTFYFILDTLLHTHQCGQTQSHYVESRVSRSNRSPVDNIISGDQNIMIELPSYESEQGLETSGV